MTNFKQITTIDAHGNRATVYVIVDTKIADVAKEGRSLADLTGEFETLKRDLAASSDELLRFDVAEAEAAREAGSADKPFDKKAWRRKRSALIDRVADLTLDIENVSARLARRREQYTATVADNATSLIAEARADAEAAQRSLSTAAGLIERSGAAFGSSTALIAALRRLEAGEGFAPAPVPAKRKPHDDFGKTTLPEIWASLAVEPLTLAIGFADRVLQEVDAVDELIEATDADDLDPDLFDVPASGRAARSGTADVRLIDGNPLERD